MSQNPRITKKFVLKATLINKTAFSISSGEGEFIDSIVVKDANDKPYIPASSLIGVLRSECNKFSPNKTAFDEFFGSGDKPSAICINDSSLNGNGEINLRNGVKIDPKTNIAKDGALYDFECVVAGSEFDFQAELTLRQMHDEKAILEIFDTLCYLIKNGFSIGAKTQNGLGKIKCKKLEICKFDFANDKNAFENYINAKFSNNYEPKFKPEKLSNTTEISLSLNIINSLLIGSTPDEKSDADVVSLNENGEFLLSGTSLKGALRNQALKIANTFAKGDLVDELFGYISEDKEQKAKKSRIKVSETQINKAVRKLHQRIKIDRFSAATIDGALFDSEAIFGSDDMLVNLEITNASKQELGLILLTLKDLCTGFLAVGGNKNIGRGVFSGEIEKVLHNGEDLSKDYERLNAFASEFSNGGVK
ncbi:RAMP superfamily CRISPR-associated protein [Campylobacter geochelonis]|uniref:RAMP superfamily CRISPR-associated protein n=1 Tax=Campylobacter geochelonis TaxID=1780362 RepID=UPI0007707020|nr:RAMP superfamily CRISPR-associated protein [Campylobacter geochelonis]CZE46256.1 CRISPR-associated RAMP protein [Campylobacter geochelonis]